MDISAYCVHSWRTISTQKLLKAIPIDESGLKLHPSFSNRRLLFPLPWRSLVGSECQAWKPLADPVYTETLTWELPWAHMAYEAITLWNLKTDESFSPTSSWLLPPLLNGSFLGFLLKCQALKWDTPEWIPGFKSHGKKPTDSVYSYFPFPTSSQMLFISVHSRVCM